MTTADVHSRSTMANMVNAQVAFHLWKMLIVSVSLIPSSLCSKLNINQLAFRQEFDGRMAKLVQHLIVLFLHLLLLHLAGEKFKTIALLSHIKQVEFRLTQLSLRSRG